MTRQLACGCGALASAAAAQAGTLAPAAGAHPFAAPDVALAAPVGSLGGLTQVTLALLIVLAAIFALAWIVRRLRGVSGRGAAALDVLADVRLGPKERAVLLKVGSTQLLVGVAPGRVNTLHVLQEALVTPAATGPETVERPSFRTILLRSLGKS